MTSQEINEGNELIIKFMGYDQSPNSELYRRKSFIVSWDLLIPVLKKVMSYKDYSYNSRCIESVFTFNRLELFNSIVYFIKRFNENDK